MRLCEYTHAGVSALGVSSGRMRLAGRVDPMDRTQELWDTGAFDPWMVTADEIRPAEELTLVARLNGREMQRATTSMMIHSNPELTRHISTFTPVEADDVIVTGIGSRRTPLDAGDIVEIEVSKIGILRNEVVAE